MLVGYSKVAQRWSTRLLTDRLWVRIPPLEPFLISAGMAEQADAQDLKSCDHCDRTGSIPVPGTTLSWSAIKYTIYGPVVQLVRTLACHARGRGFESLPDRHFFKPV